MLLACFASSCKLPLFYEYVKGKKQVLYILCLLAQEFSLLMSSENMKVANSF